MPKPKGSRLSGPVLNTNNRPDRPRGWFSSLPVGIEPTVVAIQNDFTVPSDYVSGDWDLVESGSGTQAQIVDANGALRLTTAGSTNNFEALFLKDTWHTTTAGQRLWHRSRLRVSSATSVTLLFGLSSGASTNRISFDVVTGTSTNLLCTCVAGGSSTQVDTGKAVDWTTYNDFDFITDGTAVDFYLNGSRVARITTNLPASSTNLRTSFQIVTNSNNARSLDIDYFLTANQRIAGGNL